MVGTNTFTITVFKDGESPDASHHSEWEAAFLRSEQVGSEFE